MDDLGECRGGWRRLGSTSDTRMLRVGTVARTEPTRTFAHEGPVDERQFFVTDKAMFGGFRFRFRHIFRFIFREKKENIMHEQAALFLYRAPNHLRSALFKDDDEWCLVCATTFDWKSAANFSAGTPANSARLTSIIPKTFFKSWLPAFFRVNC